MADILIYNTTTGEPVRYLKSVNTPDYIERNDVVINPCICTKTPLCNHKVDNGVLRMKTEEELAAQKQQREAENNLQNDREIARMLEVLSRNPELLQQLKDLLA